MSLIIHTRRRTDQTGCLEGASEGARDVSGFFQVSACLVSTSSFYVSHSSADASCFSCFLCRSPSCAAVVTQLCHRGIWFVHFISFKYF